MSVAVCRSSAAACFESILALPAAFPAARSTWLSPPMVAEQEEQELNEPTKDSLLPLQVEEEHVRDDEEGESESPPGQFDIWTSIQAQKAQQDKEEPYVHPLMRRSSSLLSQKSLEICTESLGSETGSNDFFSSDDETDFFSLIPKTNETEQQQQQQDQSEHSDDDVGEGFEHVERSRCIGGGIRKELATVNYHCSISRRSSQPRSFPPPLPSISRRDGPCLQMRPHRRDGRLVVEAVTVPSQNYLHAERQNGRLLLSFINTASSHNPCTATESTSNVATENTAAETEHVEEFQRTEDAAEQEEEVLEAEEEEVEVVDRGTVVEVKVSTQPQQNSCGGAAAMKVHRSSIVINKFVSCMAANSDQEKTKAISAAAAAAAAAAEAEEEEDEAEKAPPLSPVRRLATTSTTTAAAAAVAASSLSSLSAADGSHSSTNDNKLLFASRTRNREKLLHDMRGCSQLRKPLFIWEPCCIATSS